MQFSEPVINDPICTDASEKVWRYSFSDIDLVNISEYLQIGIDNEKEKIELYPLSEGSALLDIVHYTLYIDAWVLS